MATISDNKLMMMMMISSIYFGVNVNELALKANKHRANLYLFKCTYRDG
jgi:hypothetical protein